MSEFDDPEIFRAVLESLQTGVYFVDRDQKILFWNNGAEKITGYLRQEVIGRFCREHLMHRGDDNRNVLSDAAEALAGVLRDGKPTIADVSLHHKAGHRVLVRLRAVPIRNSHGTIIGAAESIEENPATSEWDRRQSKLADYGCLDAVTGVLNQAVILSHLRENLATFAEVGVPFSVLLVEVDQMDQLRAKYGLAVVSSVLRVTARTLENSLRPTDFLGRFSDTRFLAILTECGSAEVGKTAERLKRMVNASRVQWWGDEWSVTASFGGATALPGDATEALQERAEKSLAESIAAGGNRVTVTAP